MRWEMRKQNVFTRPGEAIPRRIPTIGTQAAGKYARYAIQEEEKGAYIFQIPFQILSHPLCTIEFYLMELFICWNKHLQK